MKTEDAVEVVMKALKLSPDVRQHFVLIRGIPGSGKSTLARALCAAWPDSVHCEADDYHMVNGVYAWDPAKVRHAHSWCQTKAAEAADAGRSLIVVSNTFTQLWEMNTYIKLALDAKAGLHVVARDLSVNFGNIHSVPEDSIAKMRERWQEFPGEMII